MKALVVGGTGFAGSFLAEYLLELGFEVAVTGRDRERWLHGSPIACRVQFFNVDVRDKAAVRNTIQSFQPERLYHLAAQSSVSESFRDPEGTFAVNVLGTINVLGAVAESCPSCRVLVVCSAEEYGLVQPGENPVREDQPFRPVNPYAVSKIAQDVASFQYHAAHGLHIVRARPFNHIGPRQSARFAVASFAKQIAEIESGTREPVLQVGNLTAHRDFTDVRDVVRAYHLFLEHLPSGAVANVCSGRAIAIGDILSMLLNSTSVRVRVEHDPTLERPVDIPLIVGDPSFARCASGWQAVIPIERTLVDTLAYWRAFAR